MNLKPFLFIAGAGALGIWLWQKKTAVENLQWGIKRVQFDKKNTTLTKIALLVTVRISNPTRTTVAFDRFTASLAVKGNQLTTIEANRQTNPIQIGPGTTDVVVKAWVNVLQVLRYIPDIVKQFSSGGFREALQVQGVMMAGGLTFPLSESINVSFGEPKNVAGIGKARVSLEFDTNEEAAKYFERSQLYVSAPKKGGMPGYSLNGIGSTKKNCWPRDGGHLI